MLFIGNDDVEAVLDMKTCLETMEEAYEELAEGRAGYRPRIDFYVPPDSPGPYYRWGTMEGVSRKLGVFAIRMKSDMLVWNQDGPFATEEKYCIEPGTYCGLIFLLSVRNGEPLAFINDGYIQHMRVGACAGLGAKYLSRPESETLGILGSGGMARTYAEAVCLVRTIKRIKVFSPTPGNRERFADEMSTKLGVEVVPMATPEEVVHGMDIVACATDSLTPVIKADWLEPGMHVMNVRSNEVGRDILERADLVARLGTATFPAAGDMPGTTLGSDGMFAFHVGLPEEIARIPQAPGREADRPGVTTLVDIIAGKAQGRARSEDITFLNNQGTQGLQFAAVGARAYQLARAAGLGREIPTEWFLQDIRD